MTARDAIYGRRAVRDYTSEQVSETTVRELIDAAVQAPSAVNFQPWSFVVVQDKELLDEISARATEIMRVQLLPTELKAMVAKPDWSIFYNAGTLIVVCAKPLGAHTDWDCCFAAENLMIAAREKGLGTCVIGFAWAALDLPEIRQKLNIPDGYQVVAPIVVGRPTEFPSSPGREKPEILAWKVRARV